jgi:glycosyltransferase involved in cell wall biosynthesis
VAGYTGLHGLAQGLDTLLQAAELLKAEHEEQKILFAFFGDGPDKQRLQEVAESRRLTNLRFFPTQSADSMPDVQCALDAAIVPLKNLPLFRGALPSKLFECMAAGLPIVLAIDGEARILLERANGGIYVPPEDAGALARAVRTLAGNPALCRTLGQNASRYVCTHYDRSEMAHRFDQLLRSIPTLSSAAAATIVS